MSKEPFAAEAPKYWDRNLPVVPAEGKLPALSGWTGFLGSVPGLQKRNELLETYPNKNIGLLLGKELEADLALDALDVDDDRLINVVLGLLGLNRAERRTILAGKRGKKGVTVFVLASKSLKSTVIKGVEGLGNIDFLAAGRMTIMPPSLHPETRKPYVVFGQSLLDVNLTDLPKVTEREIGLLKVITGSQHVLTLTSGRSTHEPGLAFCAQLLAAGATDEEIHAIFKGLLPEGYEGNTLDELPGWIDDGRRKGFDKVAQAGLPLDEATARTVAAELTPLAYHGGDGFLRYQDGHWPEFLDNDVDRGIKEVLLRTQTKGAVSHNLKPTRRCLELNVEQPRFGSVVDRICLLNGTLNLETGELEDHSPDHFLRHQLAIEWDEEADCPVYDEHVQAVFEDNKKAEALFDEFAAYSLVPDMSLQKALFLVGPGGSGKSTLLRVVQMVHDPRAVSATPLDKIEDERHRTDMARKLLNISYDVQTQKKVFGETFVRITGGDPITVRRLYSEVEGLVQPTVRLLGSLNPELPGFVASPDALRRRLIILPTGPRVAEPDPDRFEKLKAEAPGILARYVRALARLRHRGQFDIPEHALLEVEDYTQFQDPFDEWAADNLVADQRGVLPVADVQRQFNQWAEQNAAPHLTAQQVGMKLRRLGFRGGTARLERNGREVNTRIVHARLQRHRPKDGGF